MGTVTAYNLSNVQAALGGANPISMSEYYRGGAYVPSSRAVTVYEPAGGGFLYSSSYYWQDNYSSPTKNDPNSYYLNSTLIWAGAYIGNPGNGSSATFGGYTYYKGSGVLNDLYQVRRTSTGSQSINTSVPSSGAIALSQLLGAENP